MDRGVAALVDALQKSLLSIEGEDISKMISIFERNYTFEETGDNVSKKFSGVWDFLRVNYGPHNSQRSLTCIIDRAYDSKVSELICVYRLHVMKYGNDVLHSMGVGDLIPKLPRRNREVLMAINYEPDWIVAIVPISQAGVQVVSNLWTAYVVLEGNSDSLFSWPPGLSYSPAISKGEKGNG